MVTFPELASDEFCPGVDADTP